MYANQFSASIFLLGWHPSRARLDADWAVSLMHSKGWCKGNQPFGFQSLRSVMSIKFMDAMGSMRQDEGLVAPLDCIAGISQREVR
jgi:hypothetical protein